MRLVFGKKLNSISHGLLIALGFWLSPLSPWNDLFTNIPLAYAFGFIFSIISEALFFPAVIVGYWLSNIVGFVLMHYGYLGLNGSKFSLLKNWKTYVFTTTIYTFVVGVLAYFGILPSAGELFELIR